MGHVVPPPQFLKRLGMLGVVGILAMLTKALIRGGTMVLPGLWAALNEWPRPWVAFGAAVGVVAALHCGTQLLLGCNQRFRVLAYERQVYVTCNLVKAVWLAWMLVAFAPQILEPFGNRPWSQNAWHNASGAYAAVDLVSLLLVRGHSRSTLAHHVFSVGVNLIAMHTAVLEGPTIWKPFLVYGLFSMLACGVNGFLGARFLMAATVMRRTALATYVVACSANAAFQLQFALASGTAAVAANPLAAALYVVALVAFVNDDAVLMCFLARSGDGKVRAE
jgi:hypothetical protein